jgi:hypothetical protein
VRPLIDEILAIRLWLARVATHLNHGDLPSEGLTVDVSILFGFCVQPRREHTSISNMAELFSPCSPVRRSPTTSIVPSLVEACMRANALVHEDTCAITADSITDENTIEHAIVFR